MSVILSTVVYGLLLFAALALLLYLVGVYNQLVFLATECDRSFANVDVLLQQRHDEVPNLVEICRGYASFESGLLEKVSALRSRYAAIADDAGKVTVENELSRAVARISARVEDYPELEASEQFQKLSGRLTELETSIADRREFYNSSTASHNEYIQLFPPLLIAGPLGYRDRPLLEASDSERQHVAR